MLTVNIWYTVFSSVYNTFCLTCQLLKQKWDFKARLLSMFTLRPPLRMCYSPNVGDIRECRQVSPSKSEVLYISLPFFLYHLLQHNSDLKLILGEFCLSGRDLQVFGALLFEGIRVKHTNYTKSISLRKTKLQSRGQGVRKILFYSSMTNTVQTDIIQVQYMVLTISVKHFGWRSVRRTL